MLRYKNTGRVLGGYWSHCSSAESLKFFTFTANMFIFGAMMRGGAVARPLCSETGNQVRKNLTFNTKTGLCRSNRTTVNFIQGQVTEYQ